MGPRPRKPTAISDRHGSQPATNGQPTPVGASVGSSRVQGGRPRSVAIDLTGSSGAPVVTLPPPVPATGDEGEPGRTNGTKVDGAPGTGDATPTTSGRVARNWPSLR